MFCNDRESTPGPISRTYNLGNVGRIRPQFFLILVGPDSRTSQWQEWEWRAALEKVWADSRKTLIPLIVGPGESPPFLRDWVSSRIDPVAEPAYWTKRVLQMLKTTRNRGAHVLTIEDRKERKERLNEITRAAEAPLFDAIVFSTVCCGFMPRCALESGTVSEPRLARLTRAIFESKYSIHDFRAVRAKGPRTSRASTCPLSSVSPWPVGSWSRHKRTSVGPARPRLFAFHFRFGSIRSGNPRWIGSRSSGRSHGLAVHQERSYSTGYSPGCTGDAAQVPGREGRARHGAGWTYSLV